MTRKLPLTRAGLTLFFVGIVAGQRSSMQKMEQDYGATKATLLQHIILTANVDLLRINIPLNNGISIPSVAYDMKAKKMKASAHVWDEFKKKPIDEVKGLIRLNGWSTYGALKAYFPELSEGDFEMTFLQLEQKPGAGGTVWTEFAEFKEGQVSK
jgi:hypothetical protein